MASAASFSHVVSNLSTFKKHLKTTENKKKMMIVHNTTIILSIGIRPYSRAHGALQTRNNDTANVLCQPKDSIIIAFSDNNSTI